MSFAFQRRQQTLHISTKKVVPVHGRADVKPTDLYKYSSRCCTSYSRRIISCSHR